MLLPLSTSSSTNSEWTFITSQPSLIASTWAEATTGNPRETTVAAATANIPTERQKYDIPVLLTASIVRRTRGIARRGPVTQRGNAHLSQWRDATLKFRYPLR